MVSLTGCMGFGEEEGTDSDSNPIDAYSPPQFSTIMVDYGMTGYWDCDGTVNNNSECEYRACTKHGWHDIDGDGDGEYCDIDGHYNRGPQTIVTKIGNKIAIECIKDYDEDYCKSGEYVYVIFTSIEGLKEMIECDMRDLYYDNNGELQTIFIKCEATLGFEPASFEISSSRYYFSSYDNSYEYYDNVVFRVF